MTPKFSVGEVVILQSIDKPECNGECTIRHVVNCYGQYTDDRLHPTGIVRRTTTRIGYVFEELLSNSTTASGSTCEILWAESALRKKHQPGGMSFTELIVSLSQPVEAPSHS